MKLSKEDWLDFALQVLIKSGPEQLKIMSLCTLKNVTKGSFYHHFKNRDEFIEQLMEHWFNKTTLQLISLANQADSPYERLEQLDQMLAVTDIEAEMHIRAWALKNNQVASHLGVIDSHRQGYLQECYVGIGLQLSLARDLAMASYATFLGMLQMYPHQDKDTCLRISSLMGRKILEEYL